MPDKFPGAKSVLGLTVSETGHQPAAELPTLGDLGANLNSQFGGRARRTLSNVPGRLLGNSRLGRALSPFVEGQFNNLFAKPLSGPMQSLLTRPDPMLNFQWEIKLPPMTNAASNMREQVSSGFFDRLKSSFLGESSSISVTADQALTRINEYVEDVVLPTPSIDQSSVYRAGKRIYVPGVQDLGSFNMVFYEDQLGTANKYLELWKRLIKSDEGFYTPMNVYKKNIVINVLDSRGDMFGQATILGCFPTQKDPIQLGSSSSDSSKITQSFSADDVIYRYEPQSN